jgi:hypothetical protein
MLRNTGYWVQGNCQLLKNAQKNRALRAGKREKEKRDTTVHPAGSLKSTEVAYYTETDTVVAVAGSNVLATGRTTIARKTDPRTAAYYTFSLFIFS